ncbi:hypothetical protein SKAU_G00098150 [Synaphobranchus kaupii]|uniref:Uncharacterized protein n=1 Tax=Synaphobranchus kaupii TaxID=118154 RepID=A0A9Q1FYK8_SYNKA|nr:hypothetical protein SKAU_G00098150 [Synaphobranchus kaupii]
MIVKVQYQKQKKYIKIPEACFDIFITEVKDKFSIPEDNILSVEDETGTEVDNDVFPDLLTTNGICFVIKNELNNSGGSEVLKEYEEKGTISHGTRKVMVNILVADMVENEGRIPRRQTKERYAMGIVYLFPSLRDPHGKKGYVSDPALMSEHFYDAQKGTGFLSWRLKSVQRGTRLSATLEDSRAEENGGPMLRREPRHRDDQPDEQRCQDVKPDALQFHKPFDLQMSASSNDTLFYVVLDSYVV